MTKGFIEGHSPFDRLKAGALQTQSGRTNMAFGLLLTVCFGDSVFPDDPVSRRVV